MIHSWKWYAVKQVASHTHTHTQATMNNWKVRVNFVKMLCCMVAWVVGVNRMLLIVRLFESVNDFVPRSEQDKQTKRGFSKESFQFLALLSISLAEISNYLSEYDLHITQRSTLGTIDTQWNPCRKSQTMKWGKKCECTAIYFFFIKLHIKINLIYGHCCDFIGKSLCPLWSESVSFPCSITTKSNKPLHIVMIRCHKLCQQKARPSPPAMPSAHTTLVVTVAAEQCAWCAPATWRNWKHELVCFICETCTTLARRAIEEHLNRANDSYIFSFNWPSPACNHSELAIRMTRVSI